MVEHEAATQPGESKMNIGTPLVPHAQAPHLVQVCQRSFHNPAVVPQLLAP